MDAAKKHMKDNDQVPFLSFKVNENTVVTLLADKQDKIKDKRSGEMVEGIAFLVMHKETKKSFFTTSYVLIQKLAEFNPNDVVTIRQYKKQGNDGAITSYEVEAGAHEEQETIQTETPAAPAQEASAEDASLEDSANSTPGW